MITVIKTKLDLRKRMGDDGKLVSFQSPKAAYPIMEDIKNLRELHELLVNLEDQPRRAIIRGIAKTPKTWVTKEAIHYDFPPVHWLCLDYDKSAPEGCPEYSTDPEGALAYMLERDWSFLKGVAIAWQLGNSAGLVPSSEKMSFHLWVWLDKPIVKCRKWLVDHRFDGSLTDRCRIHYTASPVGVVGIKRNGFIEGSELSGVEDEHVETPIGEGVAVEGLDCPPWRETELIAELATITGGDGRHDDIRAWILKACAEGMMGIQEMATEQLVAMGRPYELAAPEVARLVEGAVTKIKAGQIRASDAAQVKNIFSAEDAPETALTSVEAKAQEKELLGPSVFDLIRDGGDPLEIIKEKGICGFDDMKLAELEVLLDARGLFGSQAGQLSRGSLRRLAKGSKDSAKAVPEELIKQYRQKWENTYCQEEGGGFKYFIMDDGGRIRLAGKRDEIDSVCRFLSVQMDLAQSLVFREKFYRVIHETRQIKEWVTVSKPFGDSRMFFETRDDGFLNVVVETSFSAYLGMLCARSENVIVPKNFIDLMDREYSEAFEIMRAALMRRFIGDKRSTVWLHCESNWGKSFLFDLPDLGLTIDNEYSGETFKGNDPAELGRKIFFFVDEADKFTKQMKKDSLPYRKLWGGQVTLKMPLRIIASANPIGDLSDHADQQLLNRVIKVRVKKRELKKVMNEAGFTTDEARALYEVLLVRRMKKWLEDGGSDFIRYAGRVFEEFAQSKQIEGVESNESHIRDMFWNHFLWDNVMLGGPDGKFQRKGRGDHIWIDNGSDTSPERRRLYIKKPDAWRKKFAEEYFGDRQHTIKKTLASVEATIEVLEATKCTCLPDGTQFKGFWVCLEKAQSCIDGNPMDERPKEAVATKKAEPMVLTPPRKFVLPVRNDL